MKISKSEYIDRVKKAALRSASSEEEKKEVERAIHDIMGALAAIQTGRQEIDRWVAAVLDGGCW